MEPILVQPMVYVLKLEEEKYYVGITYNLNQRYAQHIAGTGAKWTRLYKPIEIIKVIVGVTKETENAVTKEYKELYGDDNVRGGAWCKV